MQSDRVASVRLLTNRRREPFGKLVRKLLGMALLNCYLACSASVTDVGRTRETTTDMPPPGTAGDTAAAGGAASPSSDWCAVQRVLAAKCQRCHSLPPEHGAPFALVTYEDTQILNRRGEPRFVTIESVISDGFMPPNFIELDPAVEPLSEPERELVVGWCRSGGLPAADDACEPL